MNQKTQPPPIPSNRSSDKQNWLTNMSKSAGAATKIVAMQAERTKLNTVSLPSLYHALGKDCLQQKRHLDAVSELVTQLRSVLAEIKQLTDTSSDRATPQTMADRAKAAGKQAVDAAKQKQLSLKRDSIVTNIGRAVHAQHGNASGPSELVQPIQQALERISSLTEEIERQSQVGKGSFLTPKRMLLGAGALVLLILLALASSFLGDGSRGNGSQNVAIAADESQKNPPPEPQNAKPRDQPKPADPQDSKPQDQAKPSKPQDTKPQNQAKPSTPATPRPEKNDASKTPDSLPQVELALTPEQKKTYGLIIEYGGRAFADSKKSGHPIVAVKTFGLGLKLNLAKLKVFTELQHLDICASLGSRQIDQGFNPEEISHFKKLQTLAIPVATPAILSKLSSLESLETLSFEVDLTGTQPKGVSRDDWLRTSIAEIAKSKSLKNLRIGNSGSSFDVKPSLFEGIATAPSLEYLESWIPVDDAALQHISKSKSLKKLSIVFPYWTAGKPVFSAEGIKALANAPKLSCIQLGDIDDVMLAEFAKLPNIQEIIYKDKASQAAIDQIVVKRPNLKILQFKDVYDPPYSEPLKNWMHVLPPNKWRQVLYSSSPLKIVLGPFETNHTEEYVSSKLSK